MDAITRMSFYGIFAAGRRSDEHEPFADESRCASVFRYMETCIQTMPLSFTLMHAGLPDDIPLLIGTLGLAYAKFQTRAPQIRNVTTLSVDVFNSAYCGAMAVVSLVANFPLSPFSNVIFVVGNALCSLNLAFHVRDDLSALNLSLV